MLLDHVDLKEGPVALEQEVNREHKDLVVMRVQEANKVPLDLQVP